MAEPQTPRTAASEAARKKKEHLVQRFPQYKDEVAANKIWTEFCEKLDCKDAEVTEFSFNPTTTVPITEKPTRVFPSVKVSKDEFKDAKRLLETMYPIKNLDKTPPEKYEVPLTSSQQYGWNSRLLVKPKKMFSHGRHTCEITEYAASYIAAMRTTPFSKKDFVPRYLQKEQTGQKAGAGTPLPPPPKTA